MTRPFLTSVLGVWLVLSQLPRETVAGLVVNLRRLLCDNPLVNQLERKCWRMQLGNHLNALPQRGPAEFPASFSHRDSEALNILVKFIPELPQELKAILSDEQTLLRTLNHPKHQESFFSTFLKLCCKSNCVQQAKMLICNPEST